MNKYSCYLSKPGAYGWGRCSENVAPFLRNDGVFIGETTMVGPPEVDAEIVLSAVSDFRFQYTSDKMGKRNVGYGFIENNILAKQHAYYADRLWDRIACGSSWMKDWLSEAVEVDCDLVIQGVDFDQFRPEATKSASLRDTFTVGSFGKFEFRKGQDIVIKAMSLFQQMHPEVWLYYNWTNPWTSLIREFAWNSNALVRMPYSLQDSLYAGQGAEFLDAVLARNKVENRHNTQRWPMREAYLSCDVILFPNRCEAGTNLCLMEALACGIPCIATNATGHTDITGSIEYPHKDLLLNCGKNKVFYQGDTPLGEWYEPCLDEVVSKLEQAYRMRDELEKRRTVKGLSERLTWKETAKGLLGSMESLVYQDLA